MACGWRLGLRLQVSGGCLYVSHPAGGGCLYVPRPAGGGCKRVVGAVACVVLAKRRFAL